MTTHPTLPRYAADRTRLSPVRMGPPSRMETAFLGTDTRPIVGYDVAAWSSVGGYPLALLTVDEWGSIDGEVCAGCARDTIDAAIEVHAEAVAAAAADVETAAEALDYWTRAAGGYPPGTVDAEIAAEEIAAARAELTACTAALTRARAGEGIPYVLTGPPRWEGPAHCDGCGAALPTAYGDPSDD